MSNLDNYVENAKKYINNNKLNQLEALRYVYLDLGKKLSFNMDFSIGNSKTKRKIYDRSISQDKLDEDFSKKTIICKSLAYILEKILNDLNISTIVDRDDIDRRYCKHIYNTVKLDTGEAFVIDLQDDLENIQSNSRTKSFGIPINGNRKSCVFRRFDLEQIDKKIGYISDEKHYTDDYLYLFKYDLPLFDNFNEKVQFVLENIEPQHNPSMNFQERYWHHDAILSELFSLKELDKIKQVTCYRENDDKKKFVHCIAVKNKNSSDIYVYDDNEFKYNKITMEEFCKMQENGLITIDKIQGLAQFKKQQSNLSSTLTKCYMSSEPKVEPETEIEK